MEGYAHVTARHHYARKHRGASAPPTLHLHPYGMTSKLCRGYNFGSGEMQGFDLHNVVIPPGELEACLVTLRLVIFGRVHPQGPAWAFVAAGTPIKVRGCTPCRSCDRSYHNSTCHEEDILRPRISPPKKRHHPPVCEYNPHKHEGHSHEPSPDSSHDPGSDSLRPPSSRHPGPKIS